MSQAERARKSLIDHVLRQIRDIPRHSNYYLHTFYVIAKVGLQRKAKAEMLFETSDWNNFDKREETFEKVKDFVMRYIR